MGAGGLVDFPIVGGLGTSDVLDSDAPDNAGDGYPTKSTGYPVPELPDNLAPDIRPDPDYPTKIRPDNYQSRIIYIKIFF